MYRLPLTFSIKKRTGSTLISPILAAVVPVLATATLGYLWMRSGRPWGNAAFTPLVVNVGTPCVIFATFTRTSVPSASFAAIALASAVFILAFALVICVVLSLVRLPLRTFRRPPFPITGIWPQIKAQKG